MIFKSGLTTVNDAPTRRLEDMPIYIVCVVSRSLLQVGQHLV